LHYEYLMNGVHKNPQTVRLPGAEPLRAEDLQKFRAVTAPLIAGLSPPSVPAPPAAPAAPLAAPVASAPPSDLHPKTSAY
jgi:hypothetical protein